MTLPPLDLASLKRAYASGDLTPAGLLALIRERIEAAGRLPVWISLAPIDAALDRLERRKAAGEALPLYGVPFAVKDNIDVAGMETTAACPAFAYLPAQSAMVVMRLEAAGAILVGKTNMDQFATGLVGVRSPFGACASVFSAEHVSGGSSSGSAVAMASGLVSFSLGTDTAGSGRVPAAFNNIVGLKPTRGLISTGGVVPACRSLDCVSIFAGSADDAAAVLEVARGFDPADPYSTRMTLEAGFDGTGRFRFGVPSQPLQFFGDEDARALHEAAQHRLEGLGGEAVEIDFAPFERAARLLYEGPWIAERLEALRSVGFDRWEAMDPTVRTLIQGAERISAADVFAGQYRLLHECRAAEAAWDAIDLLMLPTTGTIYRIADVLADPIRLNATLGTYTNFVNLMDLSAIAIPAGFRPNGLPYGVTLIGRRGADLALAEVGARLHAALPDATVGATGYPVSSAVPAAPRAGPPMVRLAVVGAHLDGQPLNWQLTGRAARKLRTTRTSAGYRLLALAGTTPPKPGLVRDAGSAGLIELEIWELTEAAFGSFVAEVPPPLVIGTVELEDGGTVKGFLCEPRALEGATDITRFGGWRRYLAEPPAALA